MHKTTPRFWDCFDSLPEPVQELARKNFELLKQDPSHHSLRFKPVGELWSVRVGIHYRALALKRPHGFTWVWIGHHTEYDRLIK